LVVGHAFDPDAWWPGVHRSYYPTSTQKIGWLPSALWTPDYICHDDNFGPYLNISRGTIRRRISTLIVPIPQALNIQLVPEAAEIVAAGALVVTLSRDYPRESHALAAEVRRWASDDRLVLRTLLISSTDLAQFIDSAPYDEGVRDAMRQSCAGHDWLWMVEISSPAIFGESLKFGEIIIPVDRPWVSGTQLEEYPVVVHLPGYLSAVDGLGARNITRNTNDEIAAVYQRERLAGQH
jgi:hypothetical protein